MRDSASPVLRKELKVGAHSCSLVIFGTAAKGGGKPTDFSRCISKTKCGIYIQWNITHPQKEANSNRCYNRNKP